MTRFSVPIKSILGEAYYEYSLSSSTYNPTIDNEFTITCTVKSVFGNPVKDKELTLYEDGTTVGTATTNSNGIATWNITPTDWNVHHYTCNTATLDLQATGMKLTTTKTNSVITYKHYADESKRNCVITVASSTNFDIGNGEQYTFTGLIPSKYAPKNNLYIDVNRNRNISFYCWTDGTGGLYNSSSSSQTNQSVSGQITYQY